MERFLLHPVRDESVRTGCARLVVSPHRTNSATVVVAHRAPVSEASKQVFFTRRRLSEPWHACNIVTASADAS